MPVIPDVAGGIRRLAGTVQEIVVGAREQLYRAEVQNQYSNAVYQMTRGFNDFMVGLQGDANYMGFNDLWEKKQAEVYHDITNAISMDESRQMFDEAFAREEAGRRMDVASLTSRIQVEQIFADHQERLNGFIEMGDVPKALDTLDSLHAAGLITKEDLVRQKDSAEKMALYSGYKMQARTIRPLRDSVEWVTPENTQGITPEMRDELRRYLYNEWGMADRIAKEKLQEAQTQSTIGLIDDYLNGKLTQDDVLAIGPGGKYVNSESTVRLFLGIYRQEAERADRKKELAGEEKELKERQKAAADLIQKYDIMIDEAPHDETILEQIEDEVRAIDTDLMNQSAKNLLTNMVNAIRREMAGEATDIIKTTNVASWKYLQGLYRERRLTQKAINAQPYFEEPDLSHWNAQLKDQERLQEIENETKDPLNVDNPTIELKILKSEIDPGVDIPTHRELIEASIGKGLALKTARTYLDRISRRDQFVLDSHAERALNDIEGIYNLMEEPGDSPDRRAEINSWAARSNLFMRDWFASDEYRELPDHEKLDRIEQAITQVRKVVTDDRLSRKMQQLAEGRTWWGWPFRVTKSPEELLTERMVQEEFISPIHEFYLDQVIGTMRTDYEEKNVGPSYTAGDITYPIFGALEDQTIVGYHPGLDIWFKRIRNEWHQGKPARGKSSLTTVRVDTDIDWRKMSAEELKRLAGK